MEISAKEMLAVLAHVERVREELPVTAGHLSRLINLLVQKGILSVEEKSELDDEMVEHLDFVRDRLIVEPGETVKSDFEALIERAINETKQQGT